MYTVCCDLFSSKPVILTIFKLKIGDQLPNGIKCKNKMKEKYAYIYIEKIKMYLLFTFIKTKNCVVQTTDPIGIPI